MIDAKITPGGDIDVNASTGDINLTGYSRIPTDMEDAACLTQMAKMALLTERGDLLIQPMLGNELASLYGLPNKPSTAVRGESLIREALKGWGIESKVTIKSWPEDATTLAYEVKIEITPGGKELTFVMKQALAAIV